MNDNPRDALLDEITKALDDNLEGAIAARIALRDAVCAYVAVEQARGMPLATVIQTIKELLGAAEKVATKATDELAMQLIEWCIEFHRRMSGIVPVTVT
jgi:hypothetical protein